MSMWRFGVGCLILVFITAVFIPAVWAGMPGAVPLLLFGVFWVARPMTWETEFNAEAKRLLKGAK